MSNIILQTHFIYRFSFFKRALKKTSFHTVPDQNSANVEILFLNCRSYRPKKLVPGTLET